MLIIGISTAAVLMVAAWLCPLEGVPEGDPRWLWRALLSTFVGVGISKLLRNKWGLP
ncbi:MAG: hypothetical protein Q4B17_09530 [Lautropia sp.]|nr:hypothetical protein [Lautropia sp.]